MEVIDQPRRLLDIPAEMQIIGASANDMGYDQT